ncbi:MULTISPECIES: glycosyltransferase family 4 protein [unclassified Aureimonas]|uniref:glycosyltransferase family 4 protein n=1 Tax=unclassified Aureimonas TaxID=2615206 RepID=UPI0006FADCBB|nr:MULTISPECIES: glycosyltransferase family 4 protein [unclassified Aureimonas]KQT52762.1 glycosyl transferase family 1 [Aureimonas sp. Leaf427]KQT80523.1 glycosyl transferase family 1 [Aureimonas sp. Leaf460]
MRTALIAWDYPPSPTGLSTAAREIAESLAEAGTDVTVFTLDRSGRSQSAGVSIVGCEIGKRSPLGPLAAPLAVRRAVLALHREKAFDLVEATNWHGPGALLAGRPGFAFVTRNSTPAALSREPGGSVAARLDGWIVDRLEARSAKRSDGLISNTGSHAAEIAEAYRLPKDGTPHAAIGLSLKPETVARGRAAPYPGEGPAGGSGTVRILFVGKAERRKGFDLILDAAERLSCIDPPLDFELVLVGIEPSDLPAGVPASARARIRAAGRLPAEAVEIEYERAHIILAPSRYESFGLVYQEALAFGRPVVACSEDASARAFIGAPGAGLLAEPNGADLARALKTLIEDAGLRQALRARAFEASGRFSRRTLGAETLSLYEKALGRHRERTAATSP